MKYKCFAVKKGEKDKSIPLTESKEGVVARYLSETTIKNPGEFSRWHVSAEKFCRNLGIDCDTLVLKAIRNRKEVDRYQIINIHVNINERDLLVTIELKKIDPENQAEKEGRFYSFIYGKPLKMSFPLFCPTKPDFLL